MSLLQTFEKNHLIQIALKNISDSEQLSEEKKAELIKEITERDNLRIGDQIKVHYKIIENKKERIQVFEGNIISLKGSGLSKTIKVRKVSYGVGVERTFPLYSPNIAKIEVVKKGKVRRAKLYYLREKTGKSAVIKEKINFKQQEENK